MKERIRYWGRSGMGFCRCLFRVFQIVRFNVLFKKGKKCVVHLFDVSGLELETCGVCLLYTSPSPRDA